MKILQRIMVFSLVLCLQSSAEESLDDEIRSLDELIRLQKMKLDLLKSRRKADADLQDTVLPEAREGEVDREHSSVTYPQQDVGRNERHYRELGSMNNYLLERLRIQTNFSLAAYHLMTTRPSPASPRHMDRSLTNPTMLVHAIDDSDTLHVYNARGEEVLTHELSGYHGGARIVASDVEGESELGPVLATAAADGSVHVLSLRVMVSLDDRAHGGDAAGGQQFRWTVTAKSEAVFSVWRENKGTGIYATALHLYYRGNQRGLGIYIGDSSCHFSSYTANGTITGRVALTGERDGYLSAADRALGDGLGESAEGQCTPRDSGGVGRMTRIGQIMAVPVGHSIVLLHIARLHLAPKLCVGGSERIVQATIDLRSMTYVLAKTEHGTILTFNTKAQSGGNGEQYCELVRVQPPSSFHESMLPKDGESRSDTLNLPLSPFRQRSNSLISLRGHVISAHGCRAVLVNTSEVKKSRTGSYAVATMSYDHGCLANLREQDMWLGHDRRNSRPAAVISPLWLDVTPRYQRDFYSRVPVEVFVSVAYNQFHPLEKVEAASASSEEERVCVLGEQEGCVQRSLAIGQASSAEIIIYFSLIEVVEEVDELDWIKWPMMAVGIGVFLLFKYFNSKPAASSRLRGRGNGGRYRGSTGGSRPVEEESEEIRAQIQRLQEMTSNIHRMADRGGGTSTMDRPNSVPHSQHAGYGDDRQS